MFISTRPRLRWSFGTIFIDWFWRKRLYSSVKMRHREGVSRLCGDLSSIILLIFLSLLSWNTLPTSGLECSAAKRDWLTYRYKVLFTSVVSPSHSKPKFLPTQTSSIDQPVCPIPEGNTCCDKQMEMDIYAVGERELSTSLTNWLIPVAEQMESDSVALDCEFAFAYCLFIQLSLELSWLIFGCIEWEFLNKNLKHIFLFLPQIFLTPFVLFPTSYPNSFYWNHWI